ncbi:hypothetical protein B0H14DRAFT_2557363 [Mycena olivaceomarginata]|nr:hypothetical protein B0H14DRAFT_2557363 [Mycena olivaceomarginata]
MSIPVFSPIFSSQAVSHQILLRPPVPARRSSTSESLHVGVNEPSDLLGNSGPLPYQSDSELMPHLGSIQAAGKHTKNGIISIEVLFVSSYGKIVEHFTSISLPSASPRYTQKPSCGAKIQRDKISDRSATKGSVLQTLHTTIDAPEHQIWAAARYRFDGLTAAVRRVPCPSRRTYFNLIAGTGPGRLVYPTGCQKTAATAV